jgi:hypothetical protein
MLLAPLCAPKRLETQGNRAREGRGRRNFFLFGVRVDGVPWRKPVLERIFGFVEVRRVGLEVLREAAKLDSIVECIFVHKVMADQ